MSAPRALARFTRASRAAGEVERCALCSEPLPETHRHLVDRHEGGLECACRACALLFDRADTELRYRTVPDRIRFDPALALRTEDWTEIGIPVRLAFIVRERGGSWRAWMPGPAGATEAEPSASGMAALAERTPLVELLEPEVEALLVWGTRTAPVLETLLVPVDRCWALAGVVRSTWEGFDGGDAVRREIEASFAELRARARPVEAR